MADAHDNELQFWKAKRIFHIAHKALMQASKRLHEGRDARIQIARAVRLQHIAAAEWNKVQCV